MSDHKEKIKDLIQKVAEAMRLDCEVEIREETENNRRVMFVSLSSPKNHPDSFG